MTRTAIVIVTLALCFTPACNAQSLPEEPASEEPTPEAQTSLSESQEPIGNIHEPTSNTHEPMSTTFGEDRPPAARVQESGTRVPILDHGLQMTRGTQIIPEDWKLRQDIATDPNTGQIVRYNLEIRGPNGELIKALGTASYGQMLGTSFDQILRMMTVRILAGEVANINFGTPQRSIALEKAPEFQKAIRFGHDRGMYVQGLEIPVTGSRGGNPLQGVIYVGHFSSPRVPGAGTIQATLVAAPEENFENAVRVNERIAHSYRADPMFEQRREQIHQASMQRQGAEHRQRMANSRSQHQQRMANNKALFESHQQMMQNTYDANDQANRQWMDNFRNSESSAWSGNDDYTGHDYNVDGIHERSSFLDPYSGQQVSRDGNYENWYTNGLGDYYGTDDPSFDPNSMDGNWQKIEPLQPNP